MSDSVEYTFARQFTDHESVPSFLDPSTPLATPQVEDEVCALASWLLTLTNLFLAQRGYAYSGSVGEEIGARHALPSRFTAYRISEIKHLVLTELAGAHFLGESDTIIRVHQFLVDQSQRSTARPDDKPASGSAAR